MSEYRYPSCPPQVPPPNFSNVHQNFNSFQNDNSREAINNHNQCQNHVKSTDMNNSAVSHRSNFSHVHSENLAHISNDTYFSHSNDIVASNPFETNATCENGRFAPQRQAYQAPNNQFQNLHHLPSGEPIYPSYNISNNELHVQNNQFPNRINSSVINPTSVSPMHVKPNTTSQNSSNIDLPGNIKSDHNINCQNRLLNPMSSEVPFPQSQNTQSGPYVQLSHHPEAFNPAHFQANLRPNFPNAENIAMMRPHIPHALGVNVDIHRPVHPYSNNSNFFSNVQSQFLFRGNPPPNIPRMLAPVIPKSEQIRLPENEMYFRNSPAVSQNFDVKPVVPQSFDVKPVLQNFNIKPTIPIDQMPPNSFDAYPPSLPQMYRPPISTEIPSMPPLPQHLCIPRFPGSIPVNFNANHYADLTERNLLDFLSKFEKVPLKNNGNNNVISVAEFRSKLKLGCTLLKVMQISKSELTKSIHIEDNLWNSKIQEINVMKDKISEICAGLSNSVKYVHEKLKKIKKKRDYKKRQRKTRRLSKEKSKQNREELHHKIDRWLDMIKEKNSKLKRETEMKKEADDILGEVRRKILEAKRTLEKLKAFEKLRNARKENAAQKSHFVLPIHNEKFEEKVLALRNTMIKQLADYEGEERALKVMLETEQEGQLEEEARWRLKRVKQFQKRRQKDIIEALFGTTDESLPTDPLFLFYQHYNIGNTSMENLVKIRHHWDIFLVPPDCEEASTVPQCWIAPEQPRNASWENVKRE